MVYTIYLWWWLGDGLWHCFTHIISIARHHFDQHESSESCKPLRPKNTIVPASTSTVTVDPPAYNWPSLSVSDQRAQFEHRRLGNLEMAWVRMRHLSKICNMRTQPQPTIIYNCFFEKNEGLQQPKHQQHGASTKVGFSTTEDSINKNHQIGDPFELFRDDAH